MPGTDMATSFLVCVGTMRPSTGSLGSVSKSEREGLAVTLSLFPWMPQSLLGELLSTVLCSEQLPSGLTMKHRLPLGSQPLPPLLPLPPPCLLSTHTSREDAKISQQSLLFTQPHL